MLIIEGKPATGKTSLMRRLAYEWAKGEQKLADYDLVIYAEFREVREHICDRIIELIIKYTEKYKSFLNENTYDELVLLLKNYDLSENHDVLILLDGYDESSLNKQCVELHTFLTSSTLQYPLFFNIIITTRPGYLGQHRGKQGKYIFADVLGFTTEKQKEKYISNHFKSLYTDGKKNIVAIHQLLRRNDNMNALAQTPLFLTFICLVHERIVDGTILELYCNIIWWLIDRHQKDYPERNVPILFDYEGNYDKDNFEIIQVHYHQFPQLHCLGKMGLHNLNKDIFRESDCQQFNLKEIVQQVGLLRKDKYHDKRFHITTSYSFPHRTIQEFLAALFFFCSKEEQNLSNLGAATPNSKLDTTGMTQYQSFLLQVGLSHELSVISLKCKMYFENITDIKIHLTSHAFITTNGLNNKLLNAFFSHCKNVQSIHVDGSSKPGIVLLKFNNLLHLDSITFENCTFEAISELTVSNCPALKNTTIESCKFDRSSIDFAELPEIEILKCNGCTFEGNTQLSFKYCTALKYMKFWSCQFNSSMLEFIELPVIDSLEYDDCTFEANAQLSFKNCPAFKHMKFWNCQLRATMLEFIELPAIDSLECDDCTFEANAQLSFKNCSALKNMELGACTVKSGTVLGITKSKGVNTLEFYLCKIDLEAWQSITEEIKNSSVKCLKLSLQGGDFSNEHINQLQKCNGVIIEIEISRYLLRSNDHLSFNSVKNLHSLAFWKCSFEGNSQISFKDCPAINMLKIAVCKISSEAWQAITEEIKNSSIKGLTFSPVYFYYLEHVQKCQKIEEIHVVDAFEAQMGYYKKTIVPQLIELARNMQRLKRIIFDFTYEHGELKEKSKEQIEKAGQERDPTFKVSIIPYDEFHTLTTKLDEI